MSYRLRVVLERAVVQAGGQSELARKLGVSRQAIHQWIAKGRCPAERVLAVEMATGRRTRRWQIRPDLYPAPDEAA
jgi:DNA-binding transcriptional regulator YdaS (Cro superfamily)